MNLAPHIITRGTGVIAILCAALGLFYNAVTMSAAFSDPVPLRESMRDAPYFHPAFYLMSAVCIACNALLAWFGVQFVRGRTDHLRHFIYLMIFEGVYFFCLGPLWLVPKIGASIGAATGVAAGGLMYQFIILFPLWAPLLVSWARKRLQQPAPAGANG